MNCVNQQTGSQPSNFFPAQRHEIAKTEDQEYLRMQRNRVIAEPLNFPATKSVLWNRTAEGEPESLHLTAKRDVRLHISEKTLRLAHRHVNQTKSPLVCFLVGSISVDSREDSIDVIVDRFDPGREVLVNNGSKVKRKVPTTVVPGDHVVPMTLIQGLTGADSSVTHTKEEFQRAFQVLFGRISSQEPINLSHIVSLKVSCHSHGGDNETILNVNCGTITMATRIQATPVSAVPIIPTALARNLSGPLRLSEVQGVPKNGYLTMDHTRKLLLLLESDPKALSLPLLGIWVSGIYSIHHPFIWACCLRFIHSPAIQQRVLAPPNSFLLLLYSPVRSTPEFWECKEDQGESEVKMFEFYSCYENLHLEIPPGPSTSDPLCFELFPTPGGMSRSLFEQAVEIWEKEQRRSRFNEDGMPQSLEQKETYSRQGSGDEGPSPVPRPSPSPHPQNLQFVPPNVVETSLSLSFDEQISAEHTHQGYTNQQILPHPPLRKILPQSTAQKNVSPRIQHEQENGQIILQKEIMQSFPKGRGTVKQHRNNVGMQNSPSRQPLKQILAPNQTQNKGMSNKQTRVSKKPQPLKSTAVQNVPKQTGSKPEKAIGSHRIPGLNFKRNGEDPTLKVTKNEHETNLGRQQVRQDILTNNRVRSDPQECNGVLIDRRVGPFCQERMFSSVASEEIHKQHKNGRESKVFQVQRLPLETVFEGETPDRTLNKTMDETELERHITGMSEVSQSPLAMSQFQKAVNNGNVKTSSYNGDGLHRKERSHSDQRNGGNKEAVFTHLVASEEEGTNKENLDDVEDHACKNLDRHVAKEQSCDSADISPQWQRSRLRQQLKGSEKSTCDQSCELSFPEDTQIVSAVTGQLSEKNCADEVSPPDCRELLRRKEAQLRQLQEQVKLLWQQQHTTLPTPNAPLTPPRTPQFDTCSSHGNSQSPNHCPVSMVTASTNTGSSLLLGTPVKPSGKKSAATSPMKEDEMITRKRSLPSSSTELSRHNSNESQRHNLSVNLEELTNQVLQLDDPSQTLASSLHAVDIPSFFESPSGVTSPSPADQANRGEMEAKFTSPVLGESASVLMEQRQKESELHPSGKDEFTEQESMGKKSNHVSLLQRDERQFYDNLLNQVKHLLDQVQEESHPLEQSPQETQESAQTIEPEPTREEVIEATMKELEKIKRSTLGTRDMESSKLSLSAKQWPLHRSSSLTAIPDHPHINYMSFSVDETLDEVFSEAELKYLSDHQLQELQQLSNHCKKHGRDRAFTSSILQEGGSVLSRKGAVENDSSSLTALDYTWKNFSMATKEYLGKYCLGPRELIKSDSTDNHCKVIKNGAEVASEQEEPKTSFASKGCTSLPRTPDTNDADCPILDITRLKKLPKLF